MIGNVVGNYKVLEKIGEGGMGAVFKGVDLMLEREVAIKALRPELGRQPQLVERFRSEAVTLAKLNHPNIATLYSFFRQGDDFFMVMEFVRGRTLDGVVRQQGPIPADRALPLFCQALDGIGAAHKMGIVHRDIKPANVMLTSDGSIKVMDFGIARVLGTNRMTKQGAVVGTIEYMSPEQVRGQETDARSDIYSLGILLYEMLAGRVPFRSDSEFDLMRAQIDDPPPPPTQFVSSIPQAVEEAIMRALAKKPEARFQTAAGFRHALLGASVTQPAVLRETRIDNPVEETQITPSAGADVAATRIAPVAHQPAETRVAPVAAPHLPVFPPAAPARGSLFSRLTWKHYTAAGALLLFLLLFPFVLLALLGGKNEPGSGEARPAQPDPPSVQAPLPANPDPPPQIDPRSQTAPVNALEAGAPAPTNESAEAGGQKVVKPKSKSADAAARERARRRAAAERALDK